MSNPIKLTQIKKNGTTSPILVGIRNATRVGSEVTRIWATNSNTHYVKESLEEIEALMLRDQFAMSAMSGITSKALAYDSVAPYAYKCADAMLKARNNIKTKDIDRAINALAYQTYLVEGAFSCAEYIEVKQDDSIALWKKSSNKNEDAALTFQCNFWIPSDDSYITNGQLDHLNNFFKISDIRRALDIE